MTSWQPREKWEAAACCSWLLLGEIGCKEVYGAVLKTSCKLYGNMHAVSLFAGCRGHHSLRGRHRLVFSAVKQ